MIVEAATSKEKQLVQNEIGAQPDLTPQASQSMTLSDSTLTVGEDRVAHAKEIAQSKEIAKSKELSTEVSSAKLENEMESPEESSGRFSPAALAKYAAVGIGTAAVSVVGYKLVEHGVADSIAKWVINDGIVFLGCIGLALATAVGRSSSKETKNEVEVSDDK